MIHLYVKTHNETGLKYFGKSMKPKIEVLSYKGSGKYQKRHIKKHGNIVSTEIVGSFLDENECESFAMQFSKTNDIVKSDMWANLIYENGKDGAPIGNQLSDATKEKITKTLTIYPERKEIKANRSKLATIGWFWMNNGIKNIRIKSKSDILPGWNFGRIQNGKIGNFSLGELNDGSNTRGKKIYNNGGRHAYFFEGQQPVNWIGGKMEGFQGGTGAMKKGKKYDKK